MIPLSYLYIKYMELGEGNLCLQERMETWRAAQALITLCCGHGQL